MLTPDCPIIGEQPLQSESLLPAPVQPPKKIFLPLLIGIVAVALVSMGVFFEIRTGKKQLLPVPTPTPSVFTSSPNHVSDWKSYKDSNGFFEVRYPSKLGFNQEEWVFDIDSVARGKTGVGNVYFGPPSTKAGGYVWGIYFSSDICLDSLIDEIGSQFNDRKVDKKEIEVSGKPALLVTVTAEDGNWISRSVYLKDSKYHDDYYYVIKDGAVNLPEFENFYRSFKLIQEIQKETDTPPGCLDQKGVLGGCLGKNLTKNLTITPDLPCCLRIWPNDCTTASLEVENKCTEKVIIQGEEVRPGHSTLIYTIDTLGELKKLKYDYDVPYPDKDEDITLRGSVGNQEFTISYIRTHKLCE